MRCDNLNMHRDNATFDTTIQPTIQHGCGNWVLKWPALLAPGNRTDPGVEMPEETHFTPANFYRFAFSVVEQTQWFASIHKKAAQILLERPA